MFNTSRYWENWLTKSEHNKTKKVYLLFAELKFAKCCYSISYGNFVTPLEIENLNLFLLLNKSQISTKVQHFMLSFICQTELEVSCSVWETSQ